MFTKIQCGECGDHYAPLEGLLFECVTCDHAVWISDLLPSMDEGERLTVRDGVLGYFTEEVRWFSTRN